MVATSARESNRDVSAVVNTDRGEPSYVQLSSEAGSEWVASFQMQGDDNDFDPPRVEFTPRNVDL